MSEPYAESTEQLTITRDECDVSKVTTVGNAMDMAYFVCKPNRWTFQNDKIRNWMMPYVTGRVLNACAGKTRLDHDGEIVRNDIDEDRDADTHLDVSGISDRFSESSFDTIIFDPPFSDHQADEKYSGQRVNMAEAKQEFHKLLTANGRVIQFGYTTTCMKGEWDYTRDAVAVFNTVGPQNDYLAVVDRNVNDDLSNYGDTDE